MVPGSFHGLFGLRMHIKHILAVGLVNVHQWIVSITKPGAGKVFCLVADTQSIVGNTKDHGTFNVQMFGMACQCPRRRKVMVVDRTISQSTKGNGSAGLGIRIFVEIFQFELLFSRKGIAQGSSDGWWALRGQGRRDYKIVQPPANRTMDATRDGVVATHSISSCASE